MSAYRDSRPARGIPAVHCGGDVNQSYKDPIARARMGSGQCPECGEDPNQHLDSAEFWIPRRCDLTKSGVLDRICAFNATSTTTDRG